MKLKLKPSITVRSVSKKFSIPHEIQRSLKGTVLNLLTRKKADTFSAVDDVSLDIENGEFFGIIGPNGSGKSTLLKMIAGIYLPDKGRIKVRGKMSPFLELGVGFTGDLSGRDNIYLYGAVLGLTKEEIDRRFDSIVRFAELERFIDQRLKNYSSGMQVRLAFSVAIQAKAKIFLVDEVLAVGDADFQNKCFNVFKRFKDEGKTVIFVSHDLEAIKKFCDKVALIKNGRLIMTGTAKEAVDTYQNL